MWIIVFNKHELYSYQTQALGRMLEVSVSLPLSTEVSNVRVDKDHIGN